MKLGQFLWISQKVLKETRLNRRHGLKIVRKSYVICWHHFRPLRFRKGMVYVLLTNIENEKNISLVVCMLITVISFFLYIVLWLISYAYSCCFCIDFPLQLLVQPNVLKMILKYVISNSTNYNKKLGSI